jgi:hypothetical protein
MYVKRFRSIPEFIPHAYWLLTDDTLDRGNCECKYCSNIPQRVISERLGFGSTRSSSMTPSQSVAGPSQAISASGIHSSGPRGTASRPLRQTVVPARVAPAAARLQNPTKRQRNYTVMNVKPVVVLEEEDGVERLAPNQDRLNDVRSAATSSALSLPRWFRTGEVVWCKVPSSPIHNVIQFWPGIVQDWRVKSTSKARDRNLDEEGRTTLQWTVYTVRLLGLVTRVKVPDSDILPYQLHMTPQPVWDELGKLICDYDAFHWKEMEQLNPFKESFDLAAFVGPEHERQKASHDLLKRSAAPFALAASMASRLSEHYTPTHEFLHDFPALPLPARALEKGKGRASRGMKEITEVTLVFNDEDGRIMQPTRPNGPVRRTEYEGLWWGPERLWMDDLVRLKCRRGEFSPGGNPHVLNASGPSPSIASALTYHLVHPHQPGGAEDRGLFLLIKSFQPADPVAHSTYTKSRAVVTGKLFELAYADCKEIRTANPAEPLHNFSPPIGMAAFMKNRLPPPPKGFVWRPILRSGYEVQAETGVIAGRYYGRLADHPLIDVAGTYPKHQAAMFGFMPGYENAINPKRWNKERSSVESLGLERAREEVEQYERAPSVVNTGESEDADRSLGDDDFDMF